MSGSTSFKDQCLNEQSFCERGMALPAALLLLLVIASTTAVLSRSATSQLQTAKRQEATQQLFFVTDGALQEQLRQLLLIPEQWKVMASLPDRPSGYTSFQPATYAAQNGIPSCSGSGCLRNHYPTGGGLLKNLGPVTGDGKIVNTSVTMDEQYDPHSPVTEDINLNGLGGWSQVERLDRVMSPADAVGANLSTSGNVLGNSEAVRFRISAYGSKALKGRPAQSTVVAVVEMPAV